MMVQTATLPETQHDDQLHGVDTLLDIHTWWDAVGAHSDRFFETSARFSTSRPTNLLADMLIDMEIAYNTIEEIPYPPEVEEARQSLLDSMSSLLSACTTALCGEKGTTSRHIGQARSELARFDSTLNAHNVA